MLLATSPSRQRIYLCVLLAHHHHHHVCVYLVGIMYALKLNSEHTDMKFDTRSSFVDNAIFYLFFTRISDYVIR